MSDDTPYEEFIEEIEVDAVGDDDAAEAAAAAESPQGQYGVGPFTIREVSILGAWLIAFVVSFFPLYTFSFTRSAPLGQFDGPSVWTSGIDWILTIGVPTVAVFLLVLRRFSPGGIRRVGSLGVDQFASVAAAVSAVTWLAIVWNAVSTAVAVGAWLTTWVVWVEVVAMLALVVLTVFAPFIPPFAEDFQGRPAEDAHRNARQVRPVIARPRRERPAPAEHAQPEANGGYGTAGYAASAPFDPAETGAFAPSQTGAYGPADTGAFAPAETGAFAPAETGAFAPAETGAFEPAEGAVDARRETGEDTGTDAQSAQDWSAAAPAYARSGYTASEPDPVISHQPFWALVPVERDVVDEQTGAPLFRIGPTAWALVVADRGSSFLVRHDDGRVGVLYDVSGVTRG